MTTPQPIPGPQMEIPTGLEPIYTNLARISHSPADIVIDFAQILPGEAKASVRARVLMTPLSAKLLLRALNENLARYERPPGFQRFYITGKDRIEQIDGACVSGANQANQ